MNPVFHETGPDGGAVQMTLAVESVDGATRSIETRGTVAYVKPSDSLAASEWNAWAGTPALADDERVCELVAVDRRAGLAHAYRVLYAERTSSPLFSGNGSDTTRYQLAPIDTAAPADFSAVSYSGADFG